MNRTEDLVIRRMIYEDSEVISAAFSDQGWNKLVEQYQAYFEEQLNNKRKVLIAEYDGEFAGYLTILWESHYQYFLDNEIPEIVDLNVLIKFRKLGIATALIKKAESIASEDYNNIGIGVGIIKGYGDAQRLYVKLGYIPDGLSASKNNRFLEYGDEIVADDDLVICFTKNLRQQNFSNISEKTLSELFPILLEPHNPAWSDYYLTEKKFLQSVFGDKSIRINHIGSTSVAGLIAKPTVDILLEVSKDIDLQAITERLTGEGYVINTPQNDIIMYLKGYTPRGFEGQCVHIHVRYYGDWDELYFRDYLKLHPETAHEYGKLKIMLKERYSNNRDAYTEAKGVFVRKYTEYARMEFPNKYKPEN